MLLMQDITLHAINILNQPVMEMLTKPLNEIMLAEHHHTIMMGWSGKTMMRGSVKIPILAVVSNSMNLQQTSSQLRAADAKSHSARLGLP